MAFLDIILVLLLQELFGDDEAAPEDGEKPVFSDSEPDDDWDNYAAVDDVMIFFLIDREMNMHNFWVKS